MAARRIVQPMMRLFQAFLLLPMTVLAVGGFPAAAAARRPVVVELFTSQGCSSCPPADSFLARLAERRDVLALSLPVTYWDMLGWKDTLANEGNTRRQKAYDAAMGRGGIYTPQMIVDGITDVVGSREAQVEAAISARSADLRDVPITLSATGDTLHISIGAAEQRQRSEATVWLFHILSRASVHVLSGENQGRSLSYKNVVRDVRPVGLWKGQALSLDLPRSDQISAPHDVVAVLLQEGGYGRIVGAAYLASSKPEGPH